MATSDDQTAALQKAIDAFPDCFFADDMISITKSFADSFTKSAKGDEVQLSNISNLVMVGQALYDEGGDGPNQNHSGIANLYCSGSDSPTGGEGRTRFLSAYAQCFRRDFDLTLKRTSIWNPDYWADSVKETFKDIGDTVGKVGEGIGEGVGKIVLQLLPLIAVILVIGIVVLVISKKVA